MGCALHVQYRGPEGMPPLSGDVINVKNNQTQEQWVLQTVNLTI